MNGLRRGLLRRRQYLRTVGLKTVLIQTTLLLIGIELLAIMLAVSTPHAFGAQDADQQLEVLVIELAREKRARGDRRPVNLGECKLALEVSRAGGLKVVLTEIEQITPADHFTKPVERTALRHLKRLSAICEFTDSQLELFESAARGDRMRLENRIRGWHAQYGRVGKTECVTQAKAAARSIDEMLRLPFDSEQRLLGKLLSSNLTGDQQQMLADHERDEQLRLLLTGLQRVASLTNDKVALLKPLIKERMEEADSWQLPKDELQRRLASVFLDLNDVDLAFLSKSELAASKRLCQYFLNKRR